MAVEPCSPGLRCVTPASEVLYVLVNIYLSKRKARVVTVVVQRPGSVVVRRSVVAHLIDHALMPEPYPVFCAHWDVNPEQEGE